MPVGLEFHECLHGLLAGEELLAEGGRAESSIGDHDHHAAAALPGGADALARALPGGVDHIGPAEQGFGVEASSVEEIALAALEDQLLDGPEDGGPDL
ncbi:hypothetical protein [Kribbella speibonae]|uniref:Uncharacterized protein n=1 Tax=Kribbella speibonae TaxID=1572660 RepID=A0ABY2A4G0_9ACTN|nr:hypothetical protein [Kribbella speibonae]TCC22765.1 hypothetical protein E0H58_20490 [Kribbella speibonae]